MSTSKLIVMRLLEIMLMYVVLHLYTVPDPIKASLPMYLMNLLDRVISATAVE